MPLEILDVDAGFDWTDVLATIGLPHLTNECVVENDPKPKSFWIKNYKLVDYDAEEGEDIFIDTRLLVIWEQGDCGPNGPTQEQVEQAWEDLMGF